MLEGREEGERRALGVYVCARLVLAQREFTLHHGVVFVDKELSFLHEHFAMTFRIGERHALV